MTDDTDGAAWRDSGAVAVAHLADDAQGDVTDSFEALVDTLYRGDTPTAADLAAARDAVEQADFVLEKFVAPATPGAEPFETLPFGHVPWSAYRRIFEERGGAIVDTDDCGNGGDGSGVATDGGTNVLDGHTRGSTRRTARVPRELDRQVEQAIDAGRFDSYSAAVRAGLEALVDDTATEATDE